MPKYECAGDVLDELAFDMCDDWCGLSCSGNKVTADWPILARVLTRLEVRTEHLASARAMVEQLRGKVDDLTEQLREERADVARLERALSEKEAEQHG